MEHGLSAKPRRVLAMILYCLIFLFSLFAIFNIRLILLNATIEDVKGNLNLLFIHKEMNHQEFVLFKLTLFFLTASLSFILMIINFFMYQNNKYEARVLRHVHEDIKSIKENGGH